MEPKEEPVDDFPLMPVEKEIAHDSIPKEPKEEPLDLVSFENEVPQQIFVGEKICKEEELDEDEMSSSHFDVSAFGPPIDHFPIPLEMKEEIIEARDETEEHKDNGENTKCVDQNSKDPSDSGETERIKRWTRSMAKSKQYNESMDDLEGEPGPSFKKPRSEYVKKGMKETAETGEEKRRKRPTRSAAKSLKYNESVDSEGEAGHSVKKTRSESGKKDEKGTPQCILCKAYPTTAIGYAEHLRNLHKSNLKSNGIYLICSCGMEVRSHWRSPNHNKECDGLYTLHKLDVMVHSTPQCILCEAYPTTVLSYTGHISKQHRTTLKSNQIYLICSCGEEIRSHYSNPNHFKKCGGKQFTLHKLDEK